MTDDPVLTRARAAVLTMDATELAAAVAELADHPHPAAPLWAAVCRILDETGERAIDPETTARRVDDVARAAERRSDTARAVAHAACAFRLIRSDDTEQGMAELARAIVLLDQAHAGADVAVACELVAYTSTMLAPSWEGLVWTERALAAAQRGAPDVLVELVRSRFALRVLSMAEDLVAVGEVDEGRELGRRALALYEEIWHALPVGDRHAELALNLAFSHLVVDEPEPARALAVPYLDYPDPWFSALAHLAVGQAEALLRDDTAAADHLTTAAVHLRENRERWHLTLALQHLVAPLHRLGRHDEAVAVTEEVVVLSRRIAYDHQRRFEVAVRSRVRELAADERARAADAAATTDALTSLSNRRGFDRRIASLLDDPARPGVFAVIDVDHFKRVNDRHGHLAGDEVLRRVAHLLRTSVGSTDLLARWAGDEFAAVLLDADGDEARTVLERFRGRVAAERWDEVDRGLTVTVTVGAVPRRSGEAPSETFGLADQVLFEAKRAGRDRVVVEHRTDASGPPPPQRVEPRP